MARVRDRGAFFLHPLLLGIGSRVNDFRFGRQLKWGQTRASVVTAAKKLGGIILTPRDGNVIYVRFMDISGFTGVGGTEYDLTFDTNSRLSAWQTELWMSQL